MKKEDMLCWIKRRKLGNYDHWNRRPDILVLTSIEGELSQSVIELSFFFFARLSNTNGHHFEGDK